MIRIATIGSNYIVEWFLQSMMQTEGIQLEAVYSRTKERGEEFAKRYGVKKVYTNYEAMAQDSEIDAVYIASPTYCHFKHAMTMLNYKKHVLCEKPVASNKEELELMIQAAKDNDVVFMEAMKSVHTPGYHAMVDNLDKIGPVRRATIQYCQYSGRYDNYKKGIIENAFKPELSNGAIMDIGVYCTHFMTKTFGRPKRILADAFRLSNGADGAGTILATYEDKIVELIYSKVTDSKLPTQIQGEKGCMLIWECPNPEKIEIIYSDGTREELEFEAAKRNVRPGSNDEINQIATDDELKYVMHYEVKDFVALIENHQVDHEYLEASVIEMDVIDEARRQMGIVFPADKIREQ